MSEQNRNIDIKPTEEYEKAQNDAANAHVATVDYSGSYEALALKQAFVMGSNTATSAESNELTLAMLMGRRWALQERGSSDNAD